MFLTIVVSLVSVVLDATGGAHIETVLDDASVARIATLVSSTASAVLVAAAFVALRHGDRPRAFRMFDRALLVEIFITQVFVFVESSFGSITGLLVSIAMLITLRRIGRDERSRTTPPAPGLSIAAAPAVPAALTPESV